MGKLKRELDLLSENASKPLAELLEKLSPELEQTIVKKEYPSNHTLLRVQDRADSVYLLIRGCVRGVNEQVNGAMYAFARFNAPYFFGEFEALADWASYHSTLVCETDCCLALIPRETYLAWVRSDPEVLFSRARHVTRTLMKQARSERNYLFYTGYERLLTFLTTQFRENGRDGIYKLRITYQEIADCIGFSIKTIQRNLRKLRLENLIAQQGRTLVITQAQYEKMLALSIPNIDENTKFQTLAEGEKYDK